MMFTMLRCSIFLAFLLSFCLTEEGKPLIKTSLGKIKGNYKLSYGGETFAAFEGIPYAQPPIGDLRFEEPQSVKPWSGIWDASTIHECPQRNWINTESVGSEDCLYLNIYVPKDRRVPNINLDVVVYIHGGAFMMGSPSMGGPEYLMDRDIVYVSLSYRLGVLGFLSTEDGVVPGNMGMKDQVLALKWIQNHIHDFGGNPKSVTLLGLSAGAAAVHLHYFSPLSKGLFHRGISQSGTALAPWAIQDAPLKTARKLAMSVGCNDPAAKEFVKCLKERPVSQVIANSYNLFPYPRMPLAPFAPVIEKSKNAFLNDDPYILLSQGKVAKLPWITTGTTDEGLLCFMVLEKMQSLNEEWEKICPYLLDYDATVEDSDKFGVQKKIKEFYFGDDTVITDNLKMLTKIVGDRLFIINMEKAARMHAKVAPVYSYVYGYQVENDLSSQLGMPKMDGVGHGDDAQLLYQMVFGGFNLKKENLSESDVRVKDALVDMVASFAKNGDLIVEDIDWNPVKETGDFPYLYIHNEGIKMESKKELAPTEFWNSLPIKENQNYRKIKEEL